MSRSADLPSSISAYSYQLERHAAVTCSAEESGFAFQDVLIPNLLHAATIPSEVQI